MFSGVLPIGTVVLLKNSTKKLMIIGFCQKQVQEDGQGQVWDYVGCVYPEGYLGPDQSYMFNGNQIERIFSVGYQDEEQFAFKVRVDQILSEVRASEKQE